MDRKSPLLGIFTPALLICHFQRLTSVVVRALFRSLPVEIDPDTPMDCLRLQHPVHGRFGVDGGGVVERDT
jgi:hypothetical protein